MRLVDSGEDRWHVIQRAEMRRLLAALRAAFGAVAQAEAAVDRRGNDARRRFEALLYVGERMSARIAAIEAVVERPEPCLVQSMLGQAENLAPEPGSLPTKEQCKGATDPDRHLRRRGITFRRH